MAYLVPPLVNALLKAPTRLFTTCDNYSVHKSIIAVVVVDRIMHGSKVIPYHKGIGGPTQTKDKLGLCRMLKEVVEN